MTASIFQHKMTLFSIVTGAFGGDADQLPDGKPKKAQTPEEIERGQEMALAQLMGVQSLVAKMPKDLRAAAAVQQKQDSSAAAKMREQLDEARSRAKKGG